MDGVVEDVRKLGIQNWWKVAQDRQKWRAILREAKALILLLMMMKIAVSGIYFEVNDQNRSDFVIEGDRNVEF